MKRLLEIFTVFFKIGLFTIGGGYAMLPIIQKEVTENKKWMTDEEFLDAISLTNSLPGPLATNAATFIGYRCCGVKGSFAAVLGAITPSIVIILLIAMVFNDLTAYPVVQNIFKGVRPAVAALILYSVIKMGKSAKLGSYFNWLVALLAAVAVVAFNVHPVIVVLAAIAYGIFLQEKVVSAVDSRSDRKSRKEPGEKDERRDL